VRKTALIFFLTSAIVLIIGHSVFPHNHERGVCYEHCISVKKNISLSDVILNTLSRDLGKNHLKDYNGSTPYHFEGLFLPPEIIMVPDAFFTQCTLSRDDSNIIASNNSYFPRGLRAPPSYL